MLDEVRGRVAWLFRPALPLPSRGFLYECKRKKARSQFPDEHRVKLLTESLGELGSRPLNKIGISLNNSKFGINDGKCSAVGKKELLPGHYQVHRKKRIPCFKGRKLSGRGGGDRLF
ncbi:hypothetical protein GOBAR_AA15203 [Gossypium barbadense]|uniref:Uncharacterized protein n=1 Tax=Gossypium barbadense TaxID=3634 RepID=A0A2P5XQ85_GOSBA|nr:hypothetical protein GOBAR_AA15203 [Gossypium barbadense]